MKQWRRYLLQYTNRNTKLKKKLKKTMKKKSKISKVKRQLICLHKYLAEKEWIKMMFSNKFNPNKRNSINKRL